MKDTKRTTKDRHLLYLQYGVTWCNCIDGGGVNFSLLGVVSTIQDVIVGGILTLLIIDRTVVVIKSVTLWFWEANNLLC